jgi:hypothetical protein
VRVWPADVAQLVLNRGQLIADELSVVLDDLNQSENLETDNTQMPQGPALYFSLARPRQAAFPYDALTVRTM